MIVLAFLLLAWGVFSENAVTACIGLLALFAGMALQHQGRKLEDRTAQRSQIF